MRYPLNKRTIAGTNSGDGLAASYTYMKHGAYVMALVDLGVCATSITMADLSKAKIYFKFKLAQIHRLADFL
jgi:hypothetical protein